MRQFLGLNGALLLFTFAINAGLGIFIYFRDRSSEVNRSFAYLLFCIAVWTIGAFFFQAVTSAEWALIARRFTPVGSSLIASYILYFSLVFPKRQGSLPWWLKMLVILPGFIFSLLSVFSDLLVKTMVFPNPAMPSTGEAVFGPGYRFYGVYFISFFSFALINLFKSFLKAAGEEKRQIFYVLFGMGISGAIGITLSLILPLYGMSRLFTSGPHFTLILAGFLTYAIVKHKLLDIDDFLSRGVIVLAAVIILVGTVFLVVSGKYPLLLPFYSFAANFGLGAFVFFRGRRRRVNFNFSAIAVLLAAWMILSYLTNSSEYGQIIFLNRLMYALAAFIPIFSIFFCFYFPYLSEPVNPWRIMFFLTSGITAGYLALFSNLIVRDITFFNANVQIVFGRLFPLYIFYFVALLLYACLYLIRKYFGSHGLNRVQISYLFFGGSISAVLAIIFNLILPLFGNFQLTQLGPTFILVMAGFTAYSIVTHRLMSIEIVIQRSAIYLLASVIVFFAYLLIVAMFENYLKGALGYSSMLLAAFVTLAVAVIYQPLVRSFQELADWLFFRGRYDYQKTLNRISHDIAAVIKLEEVAKQIAVSFLETIRLSEISFLLLEREGKHFRSVPLAVPRYKMIEIDANTPIISWLSTKKDILVRDEIEDEITRQESLGKEGLEYKQKLTEVRDEMERLGISVWVPIVSKEVLIGIIALGNKLSGDVFTSEDLSLLTTLANQTAVALDNARLYDEVVTIKNYNEEILQSMTNGVLTTDNKGRIITFNYMAEKITGRKAREILDRTCEEVWGKKGALTVTIDNALAGHQTLNFETGVASPERGLVPVALSTTILRDNHDKKLGVLLSAQDLTELKELEGRVRRADKLTALATMAAGMAHEIKNPLSSMKVFSQLLPKKFDDPEFRQKLEELLPREINRIDRIVESLLGFARATAPTFENTKIEQIIDETLKYFEDQIKNTGVKITKQYAELPEVEVDRSQISQVFSNLILNALQAMPEGGELAITTLAGKKNEGGLQNIKIMIADTGHGMTEETVKKLFDPFFTTKYGGTGLGLTITHSIIDGHKGSIDVASEPGKGTTFTLTLPVNQRLV